MSWETMLTVVHNLLAMCPPTVAHLVVAIETALQRISAPQHATVTKWMLASVVDAPVPLAAELTFAKQWIRMAQRAFRYDCSRRSSIGHFS